MAGATFRRRARGGGWLAAAVVAWVGSLGVATPALGDKIVLRGGGQIRGKVLPDPRHADRVTVLTERGKTPLSFRKDQITDVVAEPSALDEYLTRRDAAPATAEAQYNLGLWCEGHKLPDLASLHYEAAVARDKLFAPAHQKLGHVKYGDRWLSGDELREAQGLVRDKGKWVTPEEKAQREKNRVTAAEQAAWARRIRQIREAIAYGADDRRREAEAELLEIRDPAAVAPLVKVLGDDQDAMRTLLARALGVIPGPEAARALVGVLLAETDSEVRRSVMNEVENRGDPEITSQLVKALRSETPAVVNRAGWALGQLNAVATVPSLIGALVTTRLQTVMAPPSGEGGSITAAFGSVPPVAAMPGPPIAYNGSSIAYLNGPVVGPGVAAFGATAVPYYPTSPTPYTFGASTGVAAGGGLSASRGPVPRLVTVTVQNSEVLNALVRMTGQDFGFNLPAWKRWARTSFRPDPVPARRVPQP